MTTGQGFVRAIRPIGCVLFLIVLGVFFYFCFSVKGPLQGYVPPQDSDYYAQSGATLMELKTELEVNVFPRLKGVLRCDANPEKLTIIIDTKSFEVTRSNILTYYDERLFQFVGEDAS